MSLLDQIVAHPDVVKPPDRSGEAKAWCPWHADRSGKTPNLGINVKKRIAHCFVCDEPKGKNTLRQLAEKWEIPVRSATSPAGEVVATYDYTDETGQLVFQVVRLRQADGTKAFRQRRPDPSRSGDWLWNLSGIRRVPYRLTSLTQCSPGQEWVLVVEGEKDADRLAAQGFTATTNSQGAGKWRPEYTPYFKGHKIAVLRDNDPGGLKHANEVAEALSPVALEVRMVELDGLPPKGDVSDWLDQGHSAENLDAAIEAAAPFNAAQSNGTSEPMDPFVPSKYRPIAAHIIQELRGHGFFVSAEGRHYYFDQAQRRLCELDGFDMAILLNERYQLNKTETLYNFLIEQMIVETALRGRHSTISQFAHYNVDSNVVLLDMNDGSVLKLDGHNIEVRDNGADGILFSPTKFAEPWQYVPAAGASVAETIIEPMNFVSDESCPYAPDEQRLLMLLWMLSLAFESVQPTKPLTLAVGPAHSGKSSLFRRIGQLLFGPGFQVDALRRDKEDDYWVAVTSRPFATFDNVDGYYPWLADALAQSATGVQVTKKKLYTTNVEVSYTPRCVISLTARTPTFRREDVASRLLIFHLDRLSTMRSEFELLEEVSHQRNELMSDYARLVNRVLAVPPSESAFHNMRLADFAGIAERIGRGLDAEQTTAEVLSKVRQSQFTFATEESPLFLALDLWLSEPRRTPEGEFDMGPGANGGQKVNARELWRELKDVTERNGLPFRIRNEKALGIALRNMGDELGMHFAIESGHSKRGRWYTFARKPEGTESAGSGSGREV
mgnify:FL=1